MKIFLAKDPMNIIITGVGGQGNVMASRLLAGMPVAKGFYVTIGETFGMSQRGGSVMSHLRVSQKSAPSFLCSEEPYHKIPTLLVHSVFTVTKSLR